MDEPLSEVTSSLRTRLPQASWDPWWTPALRLPVLGTTHPTGLELLSALLQDPPRQTQPLEAEHSHVSSL